MRVVTFKSFLAPRRVRWHPRFLRLRLRYWWHRKRMTKAERELADELSLRMEHALLFGREAE